MNLELPATGEKAVDMDREELDALANESAWIADHPGPEVRAMIERRRALEREMEAAIVWPAGEGYHDAAGSEVAQVRKEEP